MKTFFRGERSIDENIEYFTQLADLGKNFMTQFQTEPPNIDHYSNNLNDPLTALYWKMTVEFGVMYTQMYCDWVEKCKNELEIIKSEHKKI